MRNKTLFGILINYIIAISILFISLANGWDLSKFIKYLFIGLLGTNSILLILFFVEKILLDQGRESSFEMEINGTDDEIKELLRETLNIDENEEYKDEIEFEEWTPNNM